MCRVRDQHQNVSTDGEPSVSSVSQWFSFTLPGRTNTIFFTGMSSKLLHFASREDWPLCQWCFWQKHRLQQENWLTPAALTPGMLEQLSPMFGAIAILKCDMLLLANVFLLCDQQIPRNCRFLLHFLLIPLKYR